MNVVEDFPDAGLEKNQPLLVETKNLSNDTTNTDQVEESSYYDLACDNSLVSGDVDRWIAGDELTVSTGIQDSRTPTLHQPTVTTQSETVSPFWYILAILFSLFSLKQHTSWRCTPSTILNAAELMFMHLGRLCNRVRMHIRNIAQNRYSRELFATALDIVLVIYAVGFLVISLYQVSIIG